MSDRGAILSDVDTLQRVREAWADLIGVSHLERVQVVVSPDSPLCPKGWIGVLGLADSVTATVPRESLKGALEQALSRLTAEQAMSPQALLPYLPTTNEVLGPASLFYPDEFAPASGQTEVEEVAVDELAPLLHDAPLEDVVESGISELSGTAFVTRAADGTLVAACGYRAWPNGVAHLGVLTVPHHRREGLGQRVATAAILRALTDGLLPQWRARLVESQALAASLGLVKFGAQLSVRPT
jgi:GNAT superfamily N-acetyltransferase